MRGDAKNETRRDYLCRQKESHTLPMNQLQKYTWLIDTIDRADRISFKELSERWERDKDISDGRSLHRATFNRWRDAIYEQFGIIIDCEKAGSYRYFIANREEIGDNRLKNWMLDTFTVGNIIGENMSLKNRIIVDEIPSGRDHLTTMLEAMKEMRAVRITYRSFEKPQRRTITIEPYCVKLFENRWYVLAYNAEHGSPRLYGLDRIESAELTSAEFKLPEGFDAGEFFATTYGIVIDPEVSPQRIVIRGKDVHRHYLKSLPLHHSQRLIEENDDYADFELYLAPTYDFVMKLLQSGPKVEVMSPESLRSTIKEWIAQMQEPYGEG